MDKDIFTKRWDNVNGFTMEEALKKKENVDTEYGVNRPDANWHPAEIVPDPDKKSGYMVIIKRIKEKE